MNLKEKQRAELISAAVDIYKATGSLRKVSAELGVGPSTVGKLLITAGVYESDAYKRIKPYLDEGLSDIEIAEKTGLDRSTVSYNRPYKL